MNQLDFHPNFQYPFSRSDDRTFAPDFSDTIYTWDIDKTYLRSRFDSILDLAKAAIELAIDKYAIDGTVALLRAIRRGPGPRSRQTPLYFVSASPPQLRKILAQKMLLDGVEFDGITLKDQFAYLRRMRFFHLRSQVGYKLVALLTNRRVHPPAAQEILFGDDSESDAMIYWTYARILRGELRGAPLSNELAHLGVPTDDATLIGRLAEPIEPTDAVRRIVIHLETGKKPQEFERFAPLLVPSRSPLQAALVLLSMGEIMERGVIEVAKEIMQRGRITLEDLWGIVNDARARKLVLGPWNSGLIDRMFAEAGPMGE